MFAQEALQSSKSPDVFDKDFFFQYILKIMSVPFSVSY